MRLSDLTEKNAYLPLLALITLAALVLRVYGLAAVPPSDDDLQVLSTAVNYVLRGHFGQTMWQHPKLRNILVYASYSLLGGNVWGLKAVSLTLGTASVPLLAAVTRRLARSWRAALVAAFLLALDPLHIDFCRQAVQEVYMPFFTLLALYAAWRYREGGAAPLLLLAGLSFGLGVSSKWYVAFPMATTAALLALDSVRKPQSRPAQRLLELCYVSCTLVLLPLTVYLLTYLPWFVHQGFDLSEWMTVQRLTYLETVSHQGFNPYDLELDHSPSHWFVKPVAFADFVFAAGRPWVLLAITNPVVWLLTLPSMGYLVWRWRRERTGGVIFVVALFATSYLPLLASSRPIWLHTALAVLPFALMAVASLVTEGLQEKRYGRAALAGYLMVVALTAAPLYLLATGRGEQIPMLRPLLESVRPAAERH